MPHDDKTLSESEPITDTPKSEPEFKEEPTRMSLDDALELAGSIGEDCYEDVAAAFADEALEAAAVLKMQEPGVYARLKADIGGSQVSLHDWGPMVKDRVRELTVKKRRYGDWRPVIEDRADLHLMVEEACDALADLGHIYERGGELVEIKQGLDGAEIHPIQKGRVRELLSRAARFERITKDDAKPIKPPPAVVDSVYARGQWDLPQLEGFVDGAAMLEGGDILCTEGYHPEAQIYVRRAVEVSGLRSPTQADAQRARDHLCDLLVDFELVEENREAHESAWLASLLTILARPAIGYGCTPLFLFDANRPRVGKTRLAEMVHLIATGIDSSPQAAPSGRDSDAEMRKTITGIARSGTPIVFFDNVKGKLGGSSLELAITARRWSARILGESKTYEGKLMLTWLATSNNGQLTPDMHGRTLLTRIKSTHEAPETRTGFKYKKIMRHVRDHRADYLKSALTILRAWHVSGRPDYGLTPWGSFEEWGEVVRNAIVFAGGADPCLTREGLIEADAETRAARAVLASWPKDATYTSSELAQGMKDGRLTHGGVNHHEIAQALEELLPSSKPRSIGYRLGDWKDRIIDGRMLVREKNDASNVYVWRVRVVGEGS